MTWLRTRVLAILGVLCLLGQGALLYRAGTGAAAPDLPWPWLFLVLTVLQIVVLALFARSPEAGCDLTQRFRFLWCGLLVVATGALLAVSLVFVTVNRSGGGQAVRDGDPVVAELTAEVSDLQLRTRASLTGLEPALAAAAEQLAARLVPYGDSPAGDGSLFRDLEDWPEIWPELCDDAEGFPLEIVVWRRAERLAWTAAAEPLAGDAMDHTRLVRNRGWWYLQTLVPAGEDLRLELQIALEGAVADRLRPGLKLNVDPARADAPAELGLVLAGRNVTLESQPVIWSGHAHNDRIRARLLLGAAVAWLVAFAAVARLLLGPWGLMGALWVGRATLAAMDFFRWFGPALPGQVYPASPESSASLVDPAYFATPVAWGWFASTADALLTAALLALTSRVLINAMGLAGSGWITDSTVDPKPRWRLGQGFGSGLLFGLLTGLFLLLLRELAGLLAVNANARLIGTGVSLSFLSFWGLHTVLMLLTLALVGPVAGVAAARSWPGRAGLPAWLGGAVLAALGTIVVMLPFGGLWWPLRLLGGGLAAGLWLVAPALNARPRFLRRFAWPTVLLLAVIWGYSSLREVYDQAERAWLQRKGQLIGESSGEWTRFLLEDALAEMQEQDALSEPPAGDLDDLWRDEAAYRLWRDSSLRDLGYSCLVELVAAEGEEESLFATGFMRDFQFEVADRSLWTDAQGEPADDGWEMIFQNERRLYLGGEEEILAAEAVRSDGRGWIRVELPVRSWRLSSLLASLGGGGDYAAGSYRPRAEVDRPAMLLRGDDQDWHDASEAGFPDPGVERSLNLLKSGDRAQAEIPIGGKHWLCIWKPLPPTLARTPGEGFLLGLRRADFGEDLLDLSRLILLNLGLLFGLFLLLQASRILASLGRRRSAALSSDGGEDGAWRPGFQERFLAGYLLLGLVLLLVVGTSVDRVGYDRVRAEARNETRHGLSLAVQQLRSLLSEQARSLAGSEYIADLLVGQLSGQRPSGPLEVKQGMVFGSRGELLLDETLSNLTAEEAARLLAAGRDAPLVVMGSEDRFYVGTVIPIDLEDAFAAAEAVVDSAAAGRGHRSTDNDGFFFYRQQLDSSLLGSLADLVQGEVTLRLDGKPLLASHPAVFFTGQAPLLAEPSMMGPLLDHREGPGVFAARNRPFAYTGCQPLPVFQRSGDRMLAAGSLPAMLTVAFPDREKEYAAQRRHTVLFLAGLANLILLTALVLALVLSWSIFRPLHLLLTATRSLARGDYEAPLPDPGTDEVGRLAGAFGSMRSELQTARDRLAAREQFLTTVLDRVPVGVAVLSDTGQVVALNPAGSNILADFLPDESGETGANRLLEIVRIEAGRFDRWAGELLSEDGRCTLRGAMAPLDLPAGGTDTMLVFENITEFLRNQKLAINAELARQVAHEIKNPLTPIQLSIQLLNQAWQDRHPKLDQIVTDTVTRVLDQVTLLRSIATEFSLLGRPGDLELVAVDLRELVVRTVGAYGASDTEASGGGLQVTMQECEVPRVQADPESLQKILGNLMQNSLDAAPVGETPFIDVAWRIEPASVTMIWSDNGAGLSAEVADRLFDPYFSTKSKGTGLGLAICRNLADRMGGTISLANRDDGSGAVAELVLPRLAPPKAISLAE